MGGLLPGGKVLWGGVTSRGGLLGGALLLGGLLPGGSISQHALRQTPPVDRQTPVKILPWPNFVAAGKNYTFWRTAHRIGPSLHVRKSVLACSIEIHCIQYSSRRSLLFYGQENRLQKRFSVKHACTVPIYSCPHCSFVYKYLLHV